MKLNEHVSDEEMIQHTAGWETTATDSNYGADTFLPVYQLVQAPGCIFTIIYSHVSIKSPSFNTTGTANENRRKHLKHFYIGRWFMLGNV